MTKDDMIETLAAIEHQRWGEWQQYVHDQGCQIWFERQPVGHRSGGLVIPDFLLRRWKRQIATPYAELSEEEQQADRDQVVRYWPEVVDFVAAWLDASGAVVSDGKGGLRNARERWRKEMGA